MDLFLCSLAPLFMGLMIGKDTLGIVLLGIPWAMLCLIVLAGEFIVKEKKI